MCFAHVTRAATGFRQGQFDADDLSYSDAELRAFHLLPLFWGPPDGWIAFSSFLICFFSQRSRAHQLPCLFDFADHFLEFHCLPPRLVSLKADWPSEYCPEYDHNGGFVYSVQLSDNPARFSRMHRWCRDFCFRNMISWLSCNGNYIDARFLLAETWQIHVPRVENQRSESDQRPMHTGSQNSVPLAHMIQVVFTVYVFIVMDLCKTPTKWGLRCLLWACIGNLWQT